ncbi:zinc finger, CCHC-type containing protein [Tanacetum coccineum]
MAAATMKHMASNFVNLDKFEGVDFKRWQKKMHVLLSSMSVVYVLTTPIPEDGVDNPTMEQVRKRAKWDNDDYVCRGLILNGMSDPLFDIYENVKSFKELWDSLEAKYMAEDASSNKFLVSNFTNYKMTDSRPVFEQYNELLGILRRFPQHKMNMDESIQVSCIIDKLPPSWKDSKHTLKHLNEKLTLVELGSHLRIKESLKVLDSDKPKGNNVSSPSVVNMVEHNNSSRYNDNKGKHKHHDNTRADPNKKAKPTCIKGSVEGSSNSMKGHNMVNKSLQWVNSGAIVHVCKDRCWFMTYESLKDGYILHMGNESIALVHGHGYVDLRLNIVNDNIASSFMSISKLNDLILWHDRLGHVHFKRMQDMSKDRLIQAFDMDIEKYENPIRTLRNYSKSSHEGYKNTIELPFEDPNQHLKDFLKLVDSLDLDGDNSERTRLRLFQFSLRDQASNWLERLPAGSITTWEDLATRCLAQFFPPERTAKLCNDILMFQQNHGESLSEAWTRFKDLLQKFPHHGIDHWLKLSKFEADFKQQQSKMTKKIDIVLKAITDHKAGTLPSNMVKNSKLSTSPLLSARSYPTQDPQCSNHVHGSINAITIHPKQPNKIRNDESEEKEH